MTDTQRQNKGLIRLIKQHKKAFRIPENLNHYSEKDLLRAEKKYIKHALNNGMPPALPTALSKDRH